MKIKNIKAREILDSRGNPTIEAEIFTDFGIFLASVPSGVSTGSAEALELRDGGRRYYGKGVLKAVRNINEIIAAKLEGKEIKSQKELDQILLELDGTDNKSKLGANAILAVSMAAARALASSEKLLLWRFLAELAKNHKPSLPTPSLLCIEGGLHGGNDLVVQEFMVIPQVGTYREKLRQATETYHKLGLILKENYGRQSINVGCEGGYAPPLSKTKETLKLIDQAIKQAGYRDKIKLSLDVAASHFYKDGYYEFEGESLSSQALLDFYTSLIEEFPLVSIEDPFAEEDWQGFQAITAQLGKKLIIVGDDLLVTNPKRIRKAIKEKACNSLLLKLNQIGTVTEAIEAGLTAQKSNWQIMVSQRGGETCDDFISDFAVGISADFIKAGAPARGERVTKYNRLLRIEEELLKTKNKK